MIHESNHFLMHFLETPLKKMAAGCLVALASYAGPAAAQGDTSWRQDYRASAPKINDLVHTKLAVSFDYDNSYMYGRAWIPRDPHSSPTDSLTLDAKGMDIRKVARVKGSGTEPLKYDYD